MSDNMSDSEDSENNQYNNLRDIHEEIKQLKNDSTKSRMFVSGWDDADEDVKTVTNPKENPVNHVLWAAENGELDTLRELLTSKSGLVHAQDSDGYTPLHRASYGNHLATVSYLLSVGASTTTKTQLGWTPLHSACNWNHYQVAARLLAAGADPASVSDGEQTPLHLASAISHCKSTLLVFLLREDLVETVEKRNNTGETPKQLAKGHGIYAVLYEMVSPEVSYIGSLAFTCNPYLHEKQNK